MDVINETVARITICKHIFCQNCIETVIAKQQKCPLCRTVLSSPDKALVGPVQGTSEEKDSDSLDKMGETSSKLDVLLQILEGAIL